MLFANAYMIRKALIRKHHLAYTVSAWCTKSPDSRLKDHVKLPTLHLEVDYAEFLDDALLEAYELHDSFARNGARLIANDSSDDASNGLEWWILKPSMSDRGQGIRIFSSADQLHAIFEEWEADSESEADLESIASSSAAPAVLLERSEKSEERVTDIADMDSAMSQQAAGVITSQLRHFVMQPYINPPLLFPAWGNRKFHVRSYVLALGALRVYLYEEMLALFAPLPYVPPSTSPSGFDPRVHLTNTCLQTKPSEDEPKLATTNRTTTPVTLFSTLPSALSSDPTKDWKTTTANSIALATSQLFLAAARTQSTHFQPLPNCFEVFGLDWMLDATGQVWLLEVNAFPDFAQSGNGVEKGIVQGLWEGVLGVVGMAWLNGNEGNIKDGSKMEMEMEMEGRWRMKKVLDVDLGRR